MKQHVRFAMKGRRKPEFDADPNESPRSGNSKRTAPMVWCGIMLVFVLIATWFALK
jgi:hypothetical protein